MSKAKAPQQVIVSWSGGKDSALAFHAVNQDPNFDIVGLHTTLSLPQRRVSLHGVHETLVEAQALAIGLPLHKTYLSEPTNEHYEAQMQDAYTAFRQQGIEAIVFGDIFLEDLKNYRGQLLQRARLEGLYPLWKQDTQTIIKQLVHEGFSAMVCALSLQKLDQSFLGQTLNEEFITRLPSTVDPAGENGEFHSLLIQAPYFKQPLQVQKGKEVVQTYPYGDGEEFRSAFLELTLEP